MTACDQLPTATPDENEYNKMHVGMFSSFLYDDYLWSCSNATLGLTGNHVGYPLDNNVAPIWQSLFALKLGL